MKIRPMTTHGPAESNVAAPEKLLTGSGQSWLWHAFSDPGNRFHAGIWRGAPGKLRVNYTESESCVIIRGRVRLSDDSGASMEFGPGDGFVIEPGFQGIWESIGEVEKFYAIFE